MKAWMRWLGILALVLMVAGCGSSGSGGGTPTISAAEIDNSLAAIENAIRNEDMAELMQYVQVPFDQVVQLEDPSTVPPVGSIIAGPEDGVDCLIVTDHDDRGPYDCTIRVVHSQNRIEARFHTPALVQTGIADYLNLNDEDFTLTDATVTRILISPLSNTRATVQVTITITGELFGFPDQTIYHLNLDMVKVNDRWRVRGYEELGISW